VDFAAAVDVNLDVAALGNLGAVPGRPDVKTAAPGNGYGAGARVLHDGFAVNRATGVRYWRLQLVKPDYTEVDGRPSQRGGIGNWTAHQTVHYLQVVDQWIQ